MISCLSNAEAKNGSVLSINFQPGINIIDLKPSTAPKISCFIIIILIIIVYLLLKIISSNNKTSLYSFCYVTLKLAYVDADAFLFVLLNII